MRKIKTFPWDPLDHLNTDDERAAYLDAALEEDDPRLVAVVLDDIARSKGMGHVSSDVGFDIERSDDAAAADRRPELAAVLDVVRALGLRLRAESTAAVSMAGDEEAPIAESSGRIPAGSRWRAALVGLFRWPTLARR